MVINWTGIAIAEIVEGWNSLSINNCPNEIPQTRKYRDSYKLLIGKWPEIVHLTMSCIAISKLVEIVKNFTIEDNFLVKTEIKENGRFTNKT